MDIMRQSACLDVNPINLSLAGSTVAQLEVSLALSMSREP